MPKMRDTRTGAVLEAMVLLPLRLGGYGYETQVLVGARPNGRRHKIDVLARKDGQSYLISLKWQQVSGTAEQKVPFEVMCLTDIVQANPESYVRAYLVLGGSGWTLRDFYTSGELGNYLNMTYVRVVTLEDFVAIANKGEL